LKRRAAFEGGETKGERKEASVSKKRLKSGGEGKFSKVGLLGRGFVLRSGETESRG